MNSCRPRGRKQYKITLTVQVANGGADVAAQGAIFFGEEDDYFHHEFPSSESKEFPSTIGTSVAGIAGSLWHFVIGLISSK